MKKNLNDSKPQNENKAKNAKKKQIKQNKLVTVSINVRKKYNINKIKKEVLK